jgi:hypothetical protein
LVQISLVSGCGVHVSAVSCTGSHFLIDAADTIHEIAASALPKRTRCKDALEVTAHADETDTFTEKTVETDVVKAAVAVAEILRSRSASSETVAADDTGASTSRNRCALTDADAVIVMAAPSNP